MNILVLHHGESGVDYHRIVVPFAEIHRNGEATGYKVVQSRYIEDYVDKLGNEQRSLTVQQLKDNDIQVCVFSRNISYRANPAPAYAKLKAAGVKIVIDIDDHWELSRGHVMQMGYRKSNMSKCIFDQIKYSDAVICTQPNLRDEIKRHFPKKRIYIAPNGIDPSEPQFALDKLSYNPESLYWQGSPTHYNDLKLLQGAFNGLIDYKFTIAGYVHGDPEWERTIQLFSRDNYEYEYGVTVDKYATGYWNKGICLVPLLNNKFNRCKSELKAIEAGWFGKPVIASNTIPYTYIIKHGENGFLARNTAEFASYIKTLLRNPQMQYDFGMKLRETVAKRYTIARVNEARYELLNDIRDGAF